MWQIEHVDGDTTDTFQRCLAVRLSLIHDPSCAGRTEPTGDRGEFGTKIMAVAGGPVDEDESIRNGQQACQVDHGPRSRRRGDLAVRPYCTGEVIVGQIDGSYPAEGRSEERRVGKECRSRGGTGADKEDG